MAERADPAPLLERSTELDQLVRLVEDACTGSGGLALIEGPPGIGKTRLQEAACRRACERGMAVLSARASELDREFPFGVVRQLFEPLITGAEATRRVHLLAGAARHATAAFGDPRDEHEDVASGADPSLAHFHALYWLVANLTDEKPAVLVIDDVHWADANSLRFLQFLLPRLAELPLLVVLAGRPPEPGIDREPIDALATDRLALIVRPAPLSEGAVETLIASEFGETPDAAFSQACYEVTGGNPFLVRELVRELVANDIPPRAARAPSVRELTPDTVSRVVLLRLARLGHEASAIARAVAVLGDDTPLHRVCALAGLPDERGGELAAALAQADIFTAERPLAFAHPMLRSAVYHDMDLGERASAHRRAAALLNADSVESDAIAVHLLATEPARDRDVVETLRSAAERALARGAAQTAVACLRRALSEPPQVDERGVVALELASAELRAGAPERAARHFETGIRMTADRRARAFRAGEYAVALQAVGRDDEAFAVRERAVADVAALDPNLALSLEATLLGTARWDLSRHSWGRSRLERHRSRLSSPDRPAEWRLKALATHLEAFFPSFDCPAETLADTAERALASVARLDLLRGYASTGFFGATEVLLLADRIDPARRALNEAVASARRSGSAPGFVFTSAWRCMMLAREGALADAEADARTCVELALSQGWFSVAPMSLGFILDVLLERGELDDAERLLESSGMAERPADHRLAFDPVAHARARIRAASGNLEAARSDFASVLGRGARWNTYPSLVPPVLVAPELIAHDPDAARMDAEQMLDEARAWGTPRAIGMALRAMGLIEGGAQGLERLDEAVRVLKPSPARLEYARALVDLGAALRRANRRAVARDPLREALDLADASGAKPLAERARQELRAAGGRPRRPRLSGVEALTASERRIAALAADGLSNTEIAQALFITKKTVEAHLGNTYRKLDIQSRTQLAAALRDGPEA